MNSSSKRVGYFLITCLWLAEVYVISLEWDKFVAAGWLYWLFVSVGTMSMAHTIAFYGIGEWFRWPFTQVVKDTAGGLENVEAKPGRWQVIGELMCCPLCAGTHSATLLMLAYAARPAFGFALAAALFIASVNALMHWVTEWLQWQSRLAQEQQGTIWLEKNHGSGPVRQSADAWMGQDEDRALNDWLVEIYRAVYTENGITTGSVGNYRKDSEE